MRYVRAPHGIQFHDQEVQFFECLVFFTGLRHAGQQLLHTANLFAQFELRGDKIGIFQDLVCQTDILRYLHVFTGKGFTGTGKVVKDAFLLCFANPLLNDFFKTCEHALLYYNPGFDFNIK